MTTFQFLLYGFICCVAYYLLSWVTALARDYWNATKLNAENKNIKTNELHKSEKKLFLKKTKNQSENSFSYWLKKFVTPCGFLSFIRTVIELRSEDPDYTGFAITMRNNLSQAKGTLKKVLLLSLICFTMMTGLANAKITVTPEDPVEGEKLILQYKTYFGSPLFIYSWLYDTTEIDFEVLRVNNGFTYFTPDNPGPYHVFAIGLELLFYGSFEYTFLFPYVDYARIDVGEYLSPPVDTDGDGVFDDKDLCPKDYGTDCNGCDLECTGCAELVCPYNDRPSCAAGPCADTLCPPDGCDNPDCGVYEYAMYTPVANTCVVVDGHGECTFDDCPLTCAYADLCLPPPVDTDGDGVYDPDDVCPNEYGKACNGCPKTCSGCAVMECNERSRPRCIPSNCPDSSCPESSCNLCDYDEYGLYTPIANTCSVVNDVGICADNGCTLQCQYTPSCIDESDTPVYPPDEYFVSGTVTFVYWNADEGYSLWSVNPDGSNLKVIDPLIHKDNAYKKYMSYSPNGQYLTYLRSDGYRTIVNESGQTVAIAGKTRSNGWGDWNDKGSAVIWGAYGSGIFSLSIYGDDEMIVGRYGYRHDATIYNGALAYIEHTYGTHWDCRAQGAADNPVTSGYSAHDESLFLDWYDTQTLLLKIHNYGLYKVDITLPERTLVVPVQMDYFVLNPSKNKLVFLERGGGVYTPIYLVDPTTWQKQRIVHLHPFVKKVTDIDWINDTQLMITTGDKIYFYDIPGDKITWIPINYTESEWLGAATFK